MNHLRRNIGILCLVGCILTSPAMADFKVTVPNTSFVSDGVNPTTGSFTVLMEVDGVGSPGVSAPVSSYNFQMDVTSFGGGLANVSSLVASQGDLFDPVSSIEFTFSPYAQGTSPLGYSEGAISPPTAPAPGTLNTPIVLTNVAFSVPAGQTGTFTVDFLPDSLEFFDDTSPTPDAYMNVVGTGGTVTIAIPEPSAFLLLSLIGTVAILGNNLRRRRAAKA